jgi:uncharacterized iron-regulated protein
MITAEMSKQVPSRDDADHDDASRTRTRIAGARAWAATGTVGPLLIAIFLCLCAAACARSLAPPPPVPRAPPAVPFSFTTSIDRDHPLVGRIWNVAQRRFVAREELEAALVSAHAVLLGEKHDNPDHHRLQAAMIKALVDHGRRPAVAMEMLDLDDQPKVDDAARLHPRDVDAFFGAVAWEKKGWPSASDYAPILRVALAEGLPIIAANLPARDTHALVHGGVAALEPAVVARLGLAAPMPEPFAASLRAELAESHCGMLPASMLEPMSLAQRARDAEMAARLELGKQDGAVLIAGTGHVRKDRGVPRELARLGEGSLVSVAFAEVMHDERDPARYGAEWHADRPPFDFVWFTPRATDADPCEGMRPPK